MELHSDSQEPGEIISVFPLPTSVFYPNTQLPLHIFEPRYRQMVSDALIGNRKIGMVLLKPGWEANYYESPAIIPVGCVGTIEQHVELPEGKYNISLRGLSRFTIVKEIGGKPYRQAKVLLLKEINDQNLDDENFKQHDLINTCNEFLSLLPEKNKLKDDLKMESFKKMSHLVDEIANQLDLQVEKKQDFLEQQDVTKRAEIIRSELKLKIGLINLSRVQMEKGIDINMN